MCIAHYCLSQTDPTLNLHETSLSLVSYHHYHPVVNHSQATRPCSIYIFSSSCHTTRAVSSLGHRREAVCAYDTHTCSRISFQIYKIYYMVLLTAGCGIRLIAEIRALLWYQIVDSFSYVLLTFVFLGIRILYLYFCM